MDRRSIKTRKAIFEAFNRLLNEKNYSMITIQEIIDEADVGRSTFYSHFETKDDLLKEMCKELFEHVFVHPDKEKNHDFTSRKDFYHQLTHILYHIKDDKDEIKGLLSSESSEYFYSYIRSYYVSWLEEHLIVNGVTNKEFIINHIAGSFIEGVKWWLKTNCEISPEEMASLYEKATFASLNVEWK